MWVDSQGNERGKPRIPRGHKGPTELLKRTAIGLSPGTRHSLVNDSGFSALSSRSMGHPEVVARRQLDVPWSSDALLQCRKVFLFSLPQRGPVFKYAGSAHLQHQVFPRFRYKLVPQFYSSPRTHMWPENLCRGRDISCPLGIDLARKPNGYRG